MEIKEDNAKIPRGPFILGHPILLTVETYIMPHDHFHADQVFE